MGATDALRVLAVAEAERVDAVVAPERADVDVAPERTDAVVAAERAGTDADALRVDAACRVELAAAPRRTAELLNVLSVREAAAARDADAWRAPSAPTLTGATLP